MRVYIRRNERYADACVHECDKFGGAAVMVWGCITHHGRTELKIIEGNLNSVRYRDEILSPIVLPVITRHDNRHAFQQVNLMPHIKTIYAVLHLK